MVEAITQGLFGNMINTFLKGIVLATNTITGPISVLLNQLFPNMSDYIYNFNYFVSFYIGNGFAWFTNLLPPMTKGVIGVWLVFLISYYTILWTYVGIVKIFNIIQKLKVW